MALSCVMFSQLEYVQAKLGAHTRAEWLEISKECGVPFSTLKKIGYKQTPTPRSDTVDKIAAYFQAREKGQKPAHRKAA